MEAKEIIIFILVIGIGLVFSHQLNVVSSGSMEPVLYKGDIVLIDYNPNSIEVGDIIVYKAIWFENKPVIHRVIAKQVSNEGISYMLKGDNNNVADPYPVSRNLIISKVFMVDSKPLVIPRIGYVSLWIQEIPKIILNQ